MLGRLPARHPPFQRLLLPSLPDHVDPFDAAAVYRPATAPGHIGGDWYDALLVPDRACAAVIGDVVGHDLQAAAMAQTRNMLRALLYDQRTPPSAILSQLDRTVHAITDNPVTTACLARIEPVQPAAWGLRWSTAGHPPPLLITPDRRTRYLPPAPTCPSASTPPSRATTTPTPCPQTPP